MPHNDFGTMDDYADDEVDDTEYANVPTLYVDGERINVEDPCDFERVQVEFDDTANGMQTEQQERAPLGWCNSASITLDREDDAVHLTISVGDPRGAFGFTVRRLSEGNSVDPNGKPVLIMHVPYPDEPMPHEKLTALHPGTYRIGG